jgi:hypothetical protein
MKLGIDGDGGKHVQDFVALVLGDFLFRLLAHGGAYDQCQKRIDRDVSKPTTVVHKTSARRFGFSCCCVGDPKKDQRHYGTCCLGRQVQFRAIEPVEKCTDVNCRDKLAVG